MSIITTIISVILALAFMSAGVLKIADYIPQLKAVDGVKDIVKELEDNFSGHYNVTWLPIFKKIGLEIGSHLFKNAIGATEIFFGFLLLVSPLRPIASLILTALMGGALYTHYTVNDPVDRLIPSVVLGGLSFVVFLLSVFGGSTKTVRVKSVPKKAASGQKNKKPNKPKPKAH
eukprot:TRINITY_DN1470_c0_g1_i1.p1 TRINITY_DN1470_c0_g1~~TRINITY_DN1470_c0_g1_i1.p1  ORF type:complete len:194 (-),score=26.86 TRINITY_DN1470_c0_g1_i1:71-592(-)